MVAHGKRFRGFISYSQTDMVAARRLHGWLENYRVPLGLAVDLGDTRKLGRFFRDEEEMGAAANIGASVRGAIEDAESLIVICSPRSAKSKWVNAEILHFRKTGRGGKVFAVIIDGVPNSGNDETECFPPALRASIPDDDPDGMPIEPLGLDLRKEGRARACARLAAGLLDIEFDALWQREKRRRIVRMASAGAAAVAAVAAAAAFIIPAQFEADRARQSASVAEEGRAISERDADLAQVVLDLGDGDAEAALQRLASLHQRRPQDERVNDVVNTVLGWMRTPSEAVRDAADAGVFWTGTDFLARAPGGTTYALSADRPVRNIGLSGDRALLVFQDRIELLNDRTGQKLNVLREADLDEFRMYDWRGYVLEASTGDVLLAGQHLGVSNGSTFAAVLTVSGSDNNFGLTRPMFHPQANGDPWISRGDGQTIVTAGCTMIGVEADTKQHPEYEGAFFTYNISGGLQARGFERISPDNRFNPSDANSGCIPLRYDTGDDARTRFGGQIIGVRLSDSPPSASAWTLQQSAGPNTDRYGYVLEWESRPAHVVSSNPCALDPCQAISLGDFDDETFNEASDSGTAGWVINAAPAGQPAGTPGRLGEPLFTYFSQDNHSFVGAWCRDLGASSRCFYHRRYFEQMGDLKLIDARSASGRYLAYGPTPPLVIMDLVEMRDVSPAARSLATESGLMEFDRNGSDRLFAVVEGRLDVLEPATSGRFESVASSLSWPRDLSIYGRLARLISLPDDDVLVVAWSGKIARLNWRTGQVRWTSAAPGLEEVQAARLSSNAQWLAAFGKFGVRLLRLSDGLLVSGILHPPETLEAGADRGGCGSYKSVWQATDLLSDAALSDEGSLSVWCGRAGARFEPPPFAGNVNARLAELTNSGRSQEATAPAPGR